MTFWENIWREVAREMPTPAPRPRSWAGFFGALATATFLIAVWFPIRLVHEVFKAIDLTEKPDHAAEAHQLFAEAFALSRNLPGKSEFARSVLENVELPPRFMTRCLRRCARSTARI